VRRSEKHELKPESAHTHRYNLHYVMWHLYSPIHLYSFLASCTRPC